MKTDWKTIYCIMVSLIAFILVSLTTSDMYQSREQSKYWKTRYNLLVGLLVDDKFDPDLVPNIEARLWAREDVMLAIASTGPVGDLLGPKLGPKCRKACTYPKDDFTKWEAVCQDCCDELRRGSACYADCAKGKLPPECKNNLAPDTGCEDKYQEERTALSERPFDPLVRRPEAVHHSSASSIPQGANQS